MTQPAVTVDDLSAAAGSAQVAAATHVGPVRRENQDAYAATILAGGGVGLVLADGMGGMAGGGEAATAATTAAGAVLASGGADEDTLAAAMEAANRAVAVVRDRLRGNPGTTLTLAAVRPSGAQVAHAGDSRAYLIRGGVATAVTMDHSWVGEQVRAGALEPGSERRHPRRNVITVAVMGDDDLEAQRLSLPLVSGDVLMLCSDGFWEPLSDERIGDLLSAPGPLPDVVGAAAEAALAAGATDNVSLLAMRLSD